MEGRNITYKEIRNNDEIATYISQADMSLASMGYTDHSICHVVKCADVVKRILTALDYSPREINLGQIAAYMHDIGNVINRNNHAQTGAVMAFNMLNKLGVNSEDIATVVNAIGNHDEEDGAMELIFEDGSFMISGDILIPLHEIHSWELEVVGNIYDNPELVNGE